MMNEAILPRYAYAPRGLSEFLVPLNLELSLIAISSPTKIINPQRVVAVYQPIGKDYLDGELYEYVGVRIEPSSGVG